MNESINVSVQVVACVGRKVCLQHCKDTIN